MYALSGKRTEMSRNEPWTQHSSDCTKTLIFDRKHNQIFLLSCLFILFLYSSCTTVQKYSQRFSSTPPPMLLTKFDFWGPLTNVWIITVYRILRWGWVIQRGCNVGLRWECIRRFQKIGKFFLIPHLPTPAVYPNIFTKGCKEYDGDSDTFDSSHSVATPRFATFVVCRG